MATAQSPTAVGTTSNYDSHSSVQMTTNQRHISLISEALSHLDVPGDLITIADFGSATGLNSMKTFTAAFHSFRETSQSPILVYHIDLPNNPWSVLYNHALSSPHSYLSLPDTYVAGVGRSYYDRLFPANSISLMHAANTLHWLSTRSIVRGQLQRYIDGDSAIHAGLRGIAEADLSHFLAHRAEELKPGGRLILNMLTGLHKFEPWYHSFQRMQDEGLISPEPLQRMSIFVYPITVGYFRSVVGKYPSLRLVSLQELQSIDEHYRQFTLDGDREKFAIKRTQMYRVVTENLIRDLLREEQTQGTDLVKVYFTYMQDYLSSQPFPYEISEFDAVIEKLS